MNAKTVLSRIKSLLSKDEVQFTYAKLKDGTIVESPTFDVGEMLEIVAEDGVKTLAPDGEHELSLTDTEGVETLFKVITKDGIITERENVELADVDAETKKVEDIPQSGEASKEDAVKDAAGSVTSGTLLAEETLVPSEDMPETDGLPLDLAKTVAEMAYRIEEMEKKIAKMVEVEIEVGEEEEEEELPKLDGAPVEESVKFSIEKNKANYGKKTGNSQSSFLSKLYK